MAPPDLLRDILTEFDDRISSELNLDPLGVQVIWSAYGQRIFRNRISSISNDVRNYTLNLFNHWVIRSIVDDDSVQLGKGLHGEKAYAGKGKNAQAFKQACLLYLENLFVYCIMDAQELAGVETGGVLGISKARRKWDESEGNPRLVFSHESKAHILVRQNLLGVSGRYKTPLVEMGFFDSGYDYALPSARSLWQTVANRLTTGAGHLTKLHKLVRAHLADILAEPSREPERWFAQIPSELRKAFVNAFSSPWAVGAYARDFWLSVTELDQGAPGALYQVLNEESQRRGAAPWSAAEVFARSVERNFRVASDKEKLEHVCLLEPLLGELDLLLNVMLSAKSQSLNEVVAKWKALGRDRDTLPKLAGRIVTHSNMREQVVGTAAERLKDLLDLSNETEIRQQSERLLRYHSKIMEDRGQSPWLRLLNDEQLKIDVRTRELPEKEDRRVETWVNHYYVPQFRHFLSGFRGNA
ncbi:hypothetical protein PCO31110_00987 [Pandoraea communis]|uniref:Uncharacterized protein n=1 Tax=Pandoraea communis TaxID=2508297 RepID=A0A5E4SR45_9BURK|nr:hypothetical protein [Pandoraea communis]VVD78220.1 hypothetical protein PCO31110_00987 [Pandoraea communis]